MGHIIRVAVAIAFLGATVGSLTITRHLAALEAGIAQDAKDVRRIVEAQKAIQKQNEALTQIVKTADGMDQRMDGVLAATVGIAENVKAIGVANRVTLALNEGVKGSNAASDESLQQVVTSLKAMNEASRSIKEYMLALRGMASDDGDMLSGIAANVARMNAKIPGR